MRKIVVAAWLAASSLLAAVPAAADSPASLPPLAAGELLLETSAVGVARSPATSALMTVTVRADASSEAEARRLAAAAVQRVTAAARAAGVAAADIEADPVTVTEDVYGMAGIDLDMAMNVTMNEAADAGPPQQVHYATSTVTVRLRSAAAAPGLHRALSDIDHVTPGTPDYMLDDDSAARRAARAEALRNSRADAEAYAASMNMRIVRTLRITERTGLDLAAIAIGESSLIAREMRNYEQAQRQGQVSTYAVVGVDYALAAR